MTLSDGVENHGRGTERSVRYFDGRAVVFDSDGFFDDFEDWSEAVFQILAEEEGMTALSDAHWRAVRFLREFYAFNGRAPLNQELKKGLGSSLIELESLFPGGLKNGARRLAGLPNPKSCE
jgi:tRNA 2-thiouridine synthesizing protein E